MNPSYTNEVGASAGNPAGAPIVPGGDIILGAPKKKSRKWIVFLISGIVIVAVAIIATVILNAKGLTSKTASVDLTELVSYIENGPDGENHAEDENTETSDEEIDTEIADAIYAIRIKDNKNSEIKDYYSELNRKAEKVTDEMLSDGAMEYRLALRVLENMINYRAVSETVVEVAKTGTANAKKYLEENFDCTGIDGVMSAICRLEETYYEAVANEYFLYADRGCYKDNYYDYECLENAGTDLGTGLETPNEALGRMRRYAVLRALSDEIKTLNQKMLEKK